LVLGLNWTTLLSRNVLRQRKIKKQSRRRLMSLVMGFKGYQSGVKKSSNLRPDITWFSATGFSSLVHSIITFFLSFSLSLVLSAYIDIIHPLFFSHYVRFDSLSTNIFIAILDKAILENSINSPTLMFRTFE